jgi:hypothetical protein
MKTFFFLFVWKKNYKPIQSDTVAKALAISEK